MATGRNLTAFRKNEIMRKSAEYMQLTTIRHLSPEEIEVIE